ncbi:MAG: hypothetical protein H7A23_20500 [Leptospiraceae bacterium]|nr:hypothetical protein [Leptospiraceae bacterium]
MKKIIYISLFFLSISLFSKDKKEPNIYLKEKGSWSAAKYPDDSTISFSIRLGALEKKYSVHNVAMPRESKIDIESKINTVGGIVHFGKYFIGGDGKVNSDNSIFNRTYGAPYYFYTTTNFKPYYIMEPKYAITSSSKALESSYYNGFIGIGNPLSNDIPGSLKYDGIGLYAMLGASVHDIRFVTKKVLVWRSKTVQQPSRLLISNRLLRVKIK